MMASKTMFAKSIVESDAFYDLSDASKVLYWYLSLAADDLGFVGNPKSVMRTCRKSQEDLDQLLNKRYVLGFPSGVIVIKHWQINNNLRRDRVPKTTYAEEYSTLILDEKGAYTEVDKPMGVNGKPMGVNGSCIREKNRIYENNILENRPHPSLAEIKQFIRENEYKVNADRFFEYYENNNWMVGNGKSPMKDWKATIRSWNSREKGERKVETSYDTNQVKVQAQQPIVYKKKTL